MKYNSLVLCLLILLAVLSACGTAKATVSLTHEACSATNGVVTGCDATLVNAPTSPATFDWKASSSPNGVYFTPSSGSLAPGQTINIHIETGGKCHFTLFYTGTDGTVIKDDGPPCP